MTYNLKTRQGISFVLILTLILSGFFIAPSSGYGGTTVEIVKNHKDIYDLGYYDVWKHEDETWQNGKKPGSSVTHSYTIPEDKVPTGVTVTAITGEFNASYKAVGKDFLDYVVASGSVSSFNYTYKIGDKKTGDGEITCHFSTTLTTKTGGSGDNIKQGWQGANVEGWRYYLPTHFRIEYEEAVITELPDPPADEEITAVINAPSQAKTGEGFTVSDGTLVGSETVIDTAELYSSVDGGSKELIATWQGTGSKGQNTGGSEPQTFDSPCTVVYELIVETTSGMTDTATKTVNIIDGREINAQAILELPKYTYEVHPADAEDWSEFTIDGERYSAKRAYEEGGR